MQAAPARDYWPTEGWRTSSPAVQGVDPMRLVQADAAIRSEYSNVYSLLVVRHGYLVYERYYHGHDPSDTYNVRSITKSVTSCLVGIALARDKLHILDQRLTDLLPEYMGDVVDPRTRAITLRQLVTMTAGFAWTEDDNNRWFTSSDWVRFAVGRPLAYPPGEHFNYDTPATHLLSAILTRATGLSEAEFASRHLFRPLGIGRPYWPTDPQGRTIGSSELYLTARELARVGYL
jgi:CubicO group peptidase (beta-lactamase class C family)